MYDEKQPAVAHRRNAVEHYRNAKNHCNALIIK